jgi:Integrase core domain
MARGVVYLAVALDWFSRRVLSGACRSPWRRLSASRRWRRHLSKHGKPEIFNTDQGSQFTGAAFTGLLIKNGIATSMELMADARSSPCTGWPRNGHPPAWAVFRVGRAPPWRGLFIRPLPNGAAIADVRRTLRARAAGTDFLLLGFRLGGRTACDASADSLAGAPYLPAAPSDLIVSVAFLDARWIFLSAGRYCHH